MKSIRSLEVRHIVSELYGVVNFGSLSLIKVCQSVQLVNLDSTKNG